MKIQFIVPPSSNKKIPDRIFGCNYAFFFQHNIFMLYPAALLKSKGYEVDVTDCVVEKKSLNEGLIKDADVYVFYSVFLSRDQDIEDAKKILGKNKKAFAVFMGSDPSHKPETYIFSSRSIVARGEPEYTLLDFVNQLSRNKQPKEASFDFSEIKGLSWLKQSNKGKKVIHNKYREYIKELDKLPFPDRTLLKKPKEYYNAKFKKFPTTTILTSRSCNFQCYYCVPNSLSFAKELEYKRWFSRKPPVTVRSPKNIIKEFREIAKQGYKSVFILDDQFVWGTERTIEILEGIKDLKLEISLLARCDVIKNLELTKKMKEAGVSHVDLGIESFNPKILKYVRKRMKVADIKKSVDLLKKAKIEPEINILIGSCPLETKETIKDTFKKAEDLNVEIVHAKICAPFPGTDFNAIAKKNKWMTAKEYIPIDTASESLISYPHLSDKEMVQEIKKYYKQHYFTPKYILKQLVKIKSLKELKNKIKTALVMKKNILNK